MQIEIPDWLLDVEVHGRIRDLLDPENPVWPAYDVKKPLDANSPAAILLGLAVLKKWSKTVWEKMRTPFVLYEARLQGQVNFSIEAGIKNREGRYFISPRPTGDVYEGKWHFSGVTFMVYDVKPGDPTFCEAFARFEHDELGGGQISKATPLGFNVAHDPPRGPYIQFFFQIEIADELPSTFQEKTRGVWLTLDEIERRVELVPSHRDNILPALRRITKPPDDVEFGFR